MSRDLVCAVIWLAQMTRRKRQIGGHDNSFRRRRIGLGKAAAATLENPNPKTGCSATT